MSNLLPEKAQRYVWKGIRARFILAGSFLLIATAVLCVLVLAPSYAVFAFATAGGAQPPALRPVLDPSEISDISRAQGFVKELLPLVSGTTTPTSAISQALAKLPRGVKIDHVTYTPGTPATIMLVGVAETREAINVFRDALTAASGFRSVSVPVGALVGADGGRFTVTLTGNF
jgi:hypothetical protein